MTPQELHKAIAEGKKIQREYDGDTRYFIKNDCWWYEQGDLICLLPIVLDLSRPEQWRVYEEPQSQELKMTDLRLSVEKAYGELLKDLRTNSHVASFVADDIYKLIKACIAEAEAKKR